MSFYTKYQELGLRDIDLISWLEFNSNSDDSGPNNNDWTLETAEGTLYVAPGQATFTGQRLHLSEYDPLNFTAFFDAEKGYAPEDQCILSSSFLDGKFMFGWAASGAFYIAVANESSEIVSVKFFKKLEPSKRAIFALSKFGNVFFLYLYDPFSNEVEADQLTIDSELFHSGYELDLGDVSFGGGFGADSNFTLREFILINNGMPGFCILQLCEELWAETADSNFKFGWIARSEFTESSFEALDNINKNNTGVALPYSISPEGFSLLGNEVTEETRVFVNGEDFTSLISTSNGYITYSGLSPDDVVLADFYDGTQNLPNSVYFYGGEYCDLPKGAAPVYDLDGKRLTSNYRLIPATNMCYTFYVSFPITDNLVEI